jgi:hypothetical protein
VIIGLFVAWSIVGALLSGVGLAVALLPPAVYLVLAALTWRGSTIARTVLAMLIFASGLMNAIQGFHALPAVWLLALRFVAAAALVWAGVYVARTRFAKEETSGEPGA